MNPEPPPPQETNLAPAGSASQSSTAHSGAAGRANDENTSGAYRQRTVTHTNSERQPWWQVELAERADIARVVLYNRTDCCASRLKDVHVFVSEYPIAEQSLDDLLAQSGITHQYLSGVQGREIEVPMNSSGRYVRVQLAGTGYLSLAEVQVHGEVSILAGFDYQQAASSLLLNGGFESSLSDWESCANTGTTQTVADPSEGATALEITGSDCLYQEFAVRPGESYTLQCDAKGLLTQYTSVALSIMDQNYSELVTQEVEITSTGYQTYTATAAAPANGAIGAVTFYSEDTGVIDACSVVQE